MKKIILFISLLLIVAIGSKSLAENDSETLQVINNTPLTIEIVAPAKLIKLGSSKFTGPAGCGFFIIWGDDVTNPIPENCNDHLKHTYLKPGKYKIKASIYHPNPTDSWITDWTSEQTIIVK